MKPPELDRFNEGDYPDAPSWFPDFISVLNRFMEQVFQILNRNVSIGDNVTGRYFETKFKTRSDYATGGFDQINISWPYPVKPNAIILAQISSGTTILLNPISIQWIFGSKGLTVLYVTGLDPLTNYTVNFLCL